MRTSNVALAMAAVMLAACSESDVSPRLESWTVSAVPSMSIGLVEGDSAYLFKRIVDARLLSDGRIVVADGGLLVVREFDRDGRFVAQMGGKGSGPGSFQSLRDLWIVPPDTIVAWDTRAQRLTWFGTDRASARTMTLRTTSTTEGVGQLDFLAGVLGDGSFIFGAVDLSDTQGADRVTIEKMSTNGEDLGRLAEMTGLVRARLAEKINGPLPFSPYPYVATYGDIVYRTNGTEPIVIASSPAGERTLAFPPNDYDVEREWSAFAAHLERNNIQPFVRAVATAPRPERIPHLSGLFVDEAGRIWAKRYDPGTDAIWLGGGERGIGGTWWVADPSGTLIARVEVPTGFAPLQIGDSRILGVSVDSLGVERVEVRTISK